MYRLQTLALLLGLTGLFIYVSHWLLGPVAALVVAGVVLATQWFAFDRSHDLVLWLHRARPLSHWQAPQLQQMVEGLSRRAGIPTPRLMIYPSQMPNAFALSGRRRRAVVATSDALLRLLSPRELQGVIAHEIAHLRQRDSFVSLTAGLLVQGVTWMSQGLAILLMLLALTGVVVDGVLVLALILSAAPLAATLLQAGLMRTRERLADQTAAELTGDPQGLASALVRIQHATEALGGWLRRFRFIYTAPAETGSPWLRTHPPTQERVQLLLNPPTGVALAA